MPRETDDELETTEEGRKVLRFRQTRKRANILGWMILALAVYQFVLTPFVAWMDPNFAEFSKAVSGTNVAIFLGLCSWHAVLIGTEGFKSNKL